MPALKSHSLERKTEARILVEMKDQNNSRRGQGGFLEEVACEVGIVFWGKIAHW